MNSKTDRNTRRSKATAKGNSIDLGLGTLVLENSAGANDSDGSKASISDLENDALDKSPAQISVYEQHARANNWQELTNYCETFLDPKQPNVSSIETAEARLWWVKCQLELQAVPISMLFSPLESAAIEINKYEVRPHLIDLAHSLLKKFKEQFTANQELALAKQCSLVIDQLAPMSRADIVSEPVPKLYPVPLVDESNTSTARLIQSEIRITNNRNYLMLLGILVLFITIIIVRTRPSYLQPLLQAFEYTAIVEPITVYRSEFSAPQLKAPVPARISRVSELDAILYDIRNDPSSLMDRVKSASSTQITTVTQTSLATTESYANTESNVPSTSTGLSATSSLPSQSQGLETIDTSGPRELPRRGDGSYNQTNRRDSNGRDSRNSSSGAYSKKRLDFGPAEVPEFQNFDNPRYYKITARTEVMNRPSVRGNAVDTLSPGTEIRVEGKEGYWLRIRSQQGQIGYVLASDADRSNDW